MSDAQKEKVKRRHKYRWNIGRQLCAHERLLDDTHIRATLYEKQTKSEIAIEYNIELALTYAAWRSLTKLLTLVTF